MSKDKELSEEAKAEQEKKAQELADAEKAKKEEEAKAEQEKKAQELADAQLANKQKVKEYIVKDGNGFKKRNYSIGGKQVTLIVGEKVTEEVVRMFHEKYQEKYFELV